MMKKLVLACAALLAAGCAAAPPPGSPKLLQPMVVAPTPLAPSAWRLERLSGAPASGATLSFEPNGFSGRGPCNAFGGSFKEGPGGAVSFGSIFSTAAACLDPDLTMMEVRLLDALGATARQERAGGLLILRGADEAELAAFSRL